ncbi:hypothetical protein BDL97_19G030700 [Sphagnum fallax]|nr:hypothetical protein BDL97_19G030700 [Sphagnum fallax]KAH8931600.1 hypothetical protein BDL97_19G030700 [Sphagnum fallax]
MSWIEDFISKVLRAAKDPRGIYYSTEIEGFLRKMFWRVSGLSTKSPVESVLDKDVYSLEELLDEDDIIQECKSLNGRLINLFPFIACEIFTCEIDVILKTLVEDEELMSLLFLFLEPDRPHGTLLAGYFSKVVSCLLFRKTIPVMRYLQVLRRLVGADEHMYAFHADSLQWLAEADLLEMLVDKLSPLHSVEVQSNAANILSAITCIAPCALTSKLSSPKFIGKLFNNVLENPDSKSTLVHSLSVCISLLDPKRAASVAAAGVSRGQQKIEHVHTANPETVVGMLQRLGDLLKVLDVSTDDTVLPTTYGQLHPPLGIHRLKIVEFLAVLLKANSEGARQQLVSLGAIASVVNLLFDYPFNNMLHHHVESIISLCLESNSQTLLDHLFKDCNFLTKLLTADENPYAPDTTPELKSLSTRTPTRIGNIGHLTRLANKVVQASTLNPIIQNHLQANPNWGRWEMSVLQQRNLVENVFQWTCGRPTTMHDRPVDSDEDDFHDRDYDISTMANNLSREIYQSGFFDNEDADEDVFSHDEPSEVVISSLHLVEEQERSGARNQQTNESIFGASSDWVDFQDNDRLDDDASPSFFEDLATDTVSSPHSSGDSGSDGDDKDLVDMATCGDDSVSQNLKSELEFEDMVEHEQKENASKNVALNDGKVEVSDNLSLFHQIEEHGTVPDIEVPEWMLALREATPFENTRGRDTFGGGNNPFEVVLPYSMELAREATTPSGPSSNNEVAISTEATSLASSGDGLGPADGHMIHPLTGEEITGVEPDGTIKAMEKMHDEGVIGEAGPMYPETALVNGSESLAKDNVLGDPDFNDVNFWRTDYKQLVFEGGP